MTKVKQKKMPPTPTLFAEVSGNTLSDKTAVLLHGFLSSHHYWDKVTELIENDYKIIAIDLLGFGKSPKPRKSRYNHDDHIRAINKTLHKHGVAEPFTLVGHSMGSLLALHYAVLYEDKVEKLVLTNLPVILGKKQLRKEIFSKKLNRFGLEFGINRLTWIAARSLFKSRLLPKRTKQFLKQHDGFLSHSAASRVRSFYNVIGSHQVIDDLAKLRVPAQLLSGSTDRAIYFENIRNRIRLSPVIHHAVYDTGHHIPQRLPEDVAKKIRAAH